MRSERVVGDPNRVEIVGELKRKRPNNDLINAFGFVCISSLAMFPPLSSLHAETADYRSSIIRAHHNGAILLSLGCYVEKCRLLIIGAADAPAGRNPGANRQCGWTVLRFG